MLSKIKTKIKKIKKYRKYLALISLIILFYFLFSYIFAQVVIGNTEGAYQNYVSLKIFNQKIIVTNIMKNNLPLFKLSIPIKLVENFLNNLPLFKLSIPIKLVENFLNNLPFFKIAIRIIVNQAISYFLTIIYYATTYISGASDMYFSMWFNPQFVTLFQFGLITMFMGIAFIILHKYYGVFNIFLLIASVNLAFVILFLLNIISIIWYIPILMLSLVYLFLRFMKQW